MGHQGKEGPSFPSAIGRVRFPFHIPLLEKKNGDWVLFCPRSIHGCSSKYGTRCEQDCETKQD